MGRYPIKAQSGNQYLMVVYHCDSNAILVAPFENLKDKHRLESYNSIMARLRKNGMLVDLQIFNNEASAEYKHTITQDWGKNNNWCHRISTDIML